MAIFEKRSEQKVTLDDTQAVTCVIETAQKVDGHTEYVLRVQRGPFKENSWKLLRRYNDFVELNKQLQKSGIPLPMPGKKIIGNMRPDFIAERRHALQKYINEVLMNPILASSLPAKKFIDPDSYSSSFHDQAVQNASMCLRTEGVYVLGQTMGPIGWRLRKHYFKVLPRPPGQSGSKYLVKSSSQSHNKHHHYQYHHNITSVSTNATTTTTTTTNGNAPSSSSSGSSTTTTTTTTTTDNSNSLGDLVLTWNEYGPDKYIDEKEMNSIFKSLVSLQHPYIEPIRYASVSESGCLVIRKFYKHGSLKDMICMSTPKNPFLAKYGNPKGRTALSLKQVALYGMQILETLRFLHSKGMPYGHLHSGNIVIVNDTVRLLDIENFVLGVPAFYRPFYVQHSKIHTAETIDVYCFGHVLFEMSMGYPLQESIARQITDCPDSLKHLLESILSKEACKVGLPTLDQVAAHRFFTEFGPSSSLNNETMNPSQQQEQHNNSNTTVNKPYFKLSINAKEQIRIAAQKAETRLKDEQKSVKNQKRLVRVQELMSSEEEKKKSKQKAKLEHKQSKLKQQSSLQMHNGPIEPPGSPLNRSDSILSVSASHETISTTPASVQSVSPLPPQPPPLPHSIHQSSTPDLPVSVDDLNKFADGGDNDQNRSALLESICRFNRGSLRKVRSND